jgi:hypothetical protein
MIAADFLGDPTGTGLDMPSQTDRASGGLTAGSCGPFLFGCNSTQVPVASTGVARCLLESHWNAKWHHGAAYDKACRNLGHVGQPGLVREIIARKILAAARDGERDPDKLYERALQGGDYLRPQA